MSTELEELFDKHFHTAKAETASAEKAFDDCVRLYVCGQYKDSLIKLVENGLIKESIWTDEDTHINGSNMSLKKLYLNLVTKVQETGVIFAKDDDFGDKLTALQSTMFTVDNLNNVVAYWDDSELKLQYVTTLISGLEERGTQQETVINIQEFIKDELFKGTALLKKTGKNFENKDETSSKRIVDTVIEYMYQLINIYIFQLEINQLHEKKSELLYFHLIDTFQEEDITVNEETVVNYLQEQLQKSPVLNDSMEDTILYKLGKPRITFASRGSVTEDSDSLNEVIENAISNSGTQSEDSNSEENTKQDDTNSEKLLNLDIFSRLQKMIKFITTKLNLSEMNPQTYPLLALCIMSMTFMSFRNQRMRGIMRQIFHVLKKSLPTILQILQVLAAI